ncbi:hypothetical protein phiOC_p298 [Ochrobactrum phage vB_OspM_OC]|nr:hypothetical protein phiOC_p298 [Ochrobactrum phage vB_OspM_OC]
MEASSGGCVVGFENAPQWMKDFIGEPFVAAAWTYQNENWRDVTPDIAISLSGWKRDGEVVTKDVDGKTLRFDYDADEIMVVWEMHRVHYIK